MLHLKQSTASQAVLLGPFVDDTDGATAENGLTIANTDIRLSKNGGNMAAKTSGGGTHDENGWYTITLDATDTDTVGRLQISCKMSGALPVFAEFEVLEEEVYDSLYASGGVTLATAAALEGIAGASGGSVNISNEGDNVGGAIKSISFDGVETSGTNASVNFEAGSYHQIDDAANNIDIVYQFDVGGGRQAVEVLWKGRIVGTNDTLLFKIYNGSTWDTVKTRTGASNSSPSAPADNFAETLPLLLTHTGTGADLGKVFVRLEVVSGSNPTLYTDLLLVKAVNIGQSIGYADGRIWIDTNNGAAGTEAYVNGVADNPVDSWADALTLASSVGVDRFHVASGSSITLSGDSTNYNAVGDNWTLAFGGQDITGASFMGATVSGTFVGATAQLESCIINAITGPGMTMRSCYFNAVDITNNGTDVWAMNDCRSRVAGTGTPAFDFGVGVGSSNVLLNGYMGGIEIKNIGDTGTDNMSISGMGQMVLNANCDGGTIALRGIFRVTDNAGGNVNLVRQDPTSDQVDQGTAQGGTANSITLASTASATNGIYDPGIVEILTGPGAGESRNILGYNGTSKVAQVDKDWRTTPTSASSYIVYSSPSKGHVNEGFAQAGASTTITLNTAASTTDDIYIGQTVFVVSGTGQDQARIVTDYDGTTKIATVHRAWDTNPDATSGYVMVPTNGAGDVVVDNETNINAIKAKTDSLTFTKANEADVNLISINDVTLTGDGSGTPFDV